VERGKQGSRRIKKGDAMGNGYGMEKGLDIHVYCQVGASWYWERSSCPQSHYRGYHMNITLDHNCLIALENNENNAPFIKELLAMHDNKQVIMRVVGIGASEQLSDRTYATNFAEFKTRIAGIGLAHLEILQPIAYWGVTFWDWGIYADDHMVQLERNIHEILFPNREFEYTKFCEKKGLNPHSTEVDRKWRNAKCDALTMWSHIYYGGNTFVTDDTCAFLRETKKPRLITLGAGDILTPAGAVAKVKAALSKHI